MRRDHRRTLNIDFMESVLLIAVELGASASTPRSRTRHLSDLICVMTAHANNASVSLSMILLPAWFGAESDKCNGF